MKPSHAFVAIAAVLAFVFAASPFAAQDVSLRYRWTKGESLGYRITLKTDSQISGMPGRGDMEVEQTLTEMLRVTVDDVAADGTTTLRQTFESVKMEMDGPMGRLAYDTASPSTDPNPMVQPLKQVLGAMAGETITIVQAPDGTVRKVEGSTRIVNKITAEMSQNPAAAALSQGLKSMLSDEAMKATLEQSFSRLPSAPVKLGDTWNGELSIGNQMIGKIAGAVTFTLKAVEGDAGARTARIGVTMTMKQDTAPPSGPNDMRVRLGDAQGQGEIIFDVAQGRLRKSTMKSDMPSTITMTAPDGTPVEMRNTSTTTMTMELIEK